MGVESAERAIGISCNVSNLTNGLILPTGRAA
jgi:hypothetical protein